MKNLPDYPDRINTLGVSGQEPAPTKETEIGEVPEHWEVVELQEVVDIIYGIQAAVAHMTDSSVGIPILTNVNMTLEGKLDFTTLRYYELSKKQQEKRLQKGDVLFNWRSGSPHHVGKTAIFNMDGDYTFSSFILRFRVEEGISSVYLAYYLHWLKEQGFFMQKRQQSSVNSVFNKSAASIIPTIVPPSMNNIESPTFSKPPMPKSQRSRIGGRRCRSYSTVSCRR